MSRRMRISAFLVALIVLLVSMSACSQNQSQKTDKTSTPSAGKADEKPVDITFMMNGDSAAKPLKENDRVVAEINKRLGINLKVKTYPQSDFQKVYVAMAAGDVPDVLTVGYPNSQVSSWINDGILVPLNDYFKNMPTVNKKLQDNYKWTAVNGKYYGYVFIEELTNVTLFYRGDWTEKLGIKPPKNTDEFYTMLKAMATGDPDGNGKADTYGTSAVKLAGSDKANGGVFPPTLEYLFYAFGVPHGDWATDSKDNVIPVFELKEYKDAMNYIKRLYSEKLIDPDFFVNDKPAMEQKFYQSRIGVMQDAGFRNYARFKDSLLAVTPTAKFEFLDDFIVGPGGKKGSIEANKTGLITCVTNQAKNPEKAAALIEFMISPSGRDLLQNGIEGIHYTKKDGKYIYNEEERAVENFAPNGWSHPLAWGCVAWPLTVMYMPDTEPTKAQGVRTVEIGSKCMVNNLIPYFTAAELEPNQLGKINQEYVTKLITGEVDMDKGLEEWSKKWRSSGGDALLKSLTEEYRKTKK